MSIDKPTSIRKGEELDKIKLKAYLKLHWSNFSGNLQIEQFPSGFSNLTYFLNCDGKEYVLRRPPFGANIKGGHDMGREFNVLTRLQHGYPKAPKPILYCEDENILGAPFYLMEKVTGIILRNKAPKDFHLDEALMRKISASSIDTLAELHALELEESGLIEMGKPEGYVKRQVEGWVNRYYKAETDKLESMDEVANWLQKNIPNQEQTAFIHNDFKYDNLVLSPKDPANVIAVLDWEMATVGDPYMDLGTSLAYWCEAKDDDALKPFNLTWMPGNFTREEVVEHYQLKSGKSVPDLLFYYVFGAFKIGVIVQQIYARYKKGFTNDPRFAKLIHVVKACGKNGVKALEKGRI